MAFATLVGPRRHAHGLVVLRQGPRLVHAQGLRQAVPHPVPVGERQVLVDEFYEAAVIGPCKQLGAQLWRFDSLAVDGMVNGAARFTLMVSHAAHWFDAKIVDGLVNLVAWILQQVSLGFRKLPERPGAELRLRHVPRLPRLRLLEVPRLRFLRPFARLPEFP